MSLWYNNVGFSSKGSEDVATEMTKNFICGDCTLIVIIIISVY